MKKLYFFLALFFFAGAAQAQVVNAYANVTNINNKTISLSNVNEVADKFENNEQVIIMQMQGNVIGHTNNTNTSGSLNSMQSTGKYEIRTIASHTEVNGKPNRITFDQALENNYQINRFSSVQIISFPKFGDPHYTTTHDITALNWDGNIGGVVAFEVDGTLNLKHNISADNAGFRGGSNAEWIPTYIEYILWIIPITRHNPPLASDPSSYNTDGKYGYHAEKGEGIYKLDNNNIKHGRGKILNGAGGGNQDNAGGGGGGNFTAGGEGGLGFSTDKTKASGGLGGISLGDNISADRVFMGGGGGGGQGNNGTSTYGGNGGGIVLIKAGRIKTEGSHSTVKISANGQEARNSSQDGAGGGGAGGTVILHTYYWELANDSPLFVEANGGNGGSINSPTIHGGGGGGGQGAVIYLFSQPEYNVSSITQNGNGGCNNNLTNCSSIADAGQGNHSIGIIEYSRGPLPIELLFFNAEKAGTSRAKLYWETASEINNDYFEIERSADAENWHSIATVMGAGFSSSRLIYESEDLNPLNGINYYRLKQTDFNGETSYSKIKSIIFSFDGIPEEEVSVYPNPSAGVINVAYKNLPNCEVVLYNSLNQPIEVAYSISEQIIQFQVYDIPNGIYFISIICESNIITRKVVVSK